jgi:di/tricarboxylate transporter
VLTLVGLVVLVAVTLIFDVDVGLVAISVAVVLTLTAPRLQKEAVNEIKWPVVLLICGVLTYVGVLEEMGTIDWVGENVASIGVPLLAALLLCYVRAIVSAFASSVGVLGAFWRCRSCCRVRLARSERSRRWRWRPRSWT